MKILALDTSGTATAVALVEDGQLVADCLLNAALNHSTTLMPSIDFLLRQAGWRPSDLTRIVVAQGPGSYTGIRIAVTCAKTLALTLGCELVGLSSLAALASAATADRELVAPLINARRGYVYAGLYQQGVAVLADRHVLLADFLSRLTESLSAATEPRQLVFTGDAANFSDEILATFPSAAIVTDSREKLPSAYGLARLGATREPVSDIHNFNPIYLKKVEAEEKWEAEHGASGEAQGLVARI